MRLAGLVLSLLFVLLIFFFSFLLLLLVLLLFALFERLHGRFVFFVLFIVIIVIVQEPCHVVRRCCVPTQHFRVRGSLSGAAAEVFLTSHHQRGAATRRRAAVAVAAKCTTHVQHVDKGFERQQKRGGAFELGGLQHVQREVHVLCVRAPTAAAAIGRVA